MAGLAGSSDSLQVLTARWPGRESQIAALHSWLFGRIGSHVIVHGPSGTGKTGVVRDCLETWGCRYAYMTMPQEYKLRQLFNSLLSQLWSYSGLKRKREGGFGATAGADSWNDFAEHIADVCPPGAEHCSMIVLDDMEWCAHRNLLPQLLAAIKWHRASVVVVTITATAPQDVLFGPGLGLALPLMRCLHFPAYDREQLCAALAVRLPTACGAAAAAAGSGPPAATNGNTTPSPELYGSFLGAYVVTPFSPLTRSAADLAAVAAWLWPIYSRPLEEGKVRMDAPAESQVRQLDVPMKQRDVIRKLLEVYRPGMRSLTPGLLPSATAAAPQPTAAAGPSAAAAAPGGGGSEEADGGGALVQNLGKAAKLLLLAAYVASRNKPTLDKELFDFRKRPTARRRAGAGRAGEAAQEADRQAEAAKEARLKGPHAFPLTRLLSIFHRLWASAPAIEDDLYGNLYGSFFCRSAGGVEPDVLDVDLATGFAGGRTGLEVCTARCTASFLPHF
ncbi:origin recognition complex subunit 5 [Volvox carteri f. nagariensis]|uniref:Origin recognition complex subunit 5 n=1 Tax=Volvox carteri f. nagariensis TaxID=3068 RepID=D8UE70_VOLCA|nr:origin recognition complex subunit 5 [Volvox carteri f. nagariensis]EFJ41955.1 origin recognition complex subunit 5 [Volvox carteri f. nagariensis]|eukprot:XP_002956992.1 origin recognition complex subunit 5 [Volvox carteri f. nagariensis]